MTKPYSSVGFFADNATHPQDISNVEKDLCLSNVRREIVNISHCYKNKVVDSCPGMRTNKTVFKNILGSYQCGEDSIKLWSKLPRNDQSNGHSWNLIKSEKWDGQIRCLDTLFSEQGCRFDNYNTNTRNTVLILISIVIGSIFVIGLCSALIGALCGCARDKHSERSSEETLLKENLIQSQKKQAAQSPQPATQSPRLTEKKACLK